MNRHLSELLMNVVTAVCSPTERQPVRAGGLKRPGPRALGSWSGSDRLEEDWGGVRGLSEASENTCAALFNKTVCYYLLTCWPNWKQNFTPNITRLGGDTRVLQLGLHHRCSSHREPSSRRAPFVQPDGLFESVQPLIVSAMR